MVVGQRFGGEEVEGGGRRVGQEGLQDGEVDGQGLAGGSGRRQDDVVAVQRSGNRLGLVGVRGLYAGRARGRHQAGVQGGGPWGGAGRPGRQPLPGGHVAHHLRIRPQTSQKGEEGVSGQ